MRGRFGVVLGAVAVLAGCIDQSRVNTECRWSDSELRLLDLTKASDREHLRVDAKIAGELGLRLADLRYRNNPTLNRPIRTTCTEALFDSIIVRHGVTREQIRVAERARVWWVDVVLSFLPIAALLAFAMDRVALRVCRAFEPEDRTIATASLAALIIVVAAVGLGVSQFWSFGVEGWLLRNGHVSFRAFQVPTIAHGWISFGAALVIAGTAGVRRFVVTPLSGAGDSYYHRRARPRRIATAR
jgi:hypothetical protein